MNAQRIVDILLEDDEIDISPAEVVSGADESRFKRALVALQDPANSGRWKTKWDNALKALGYVHNPWVWLATNTLESGSIQIIQGAGTADSVYSALRPHLQKRLNMPERDLEIVYRLLATIKAQESDEIQGDDEDWYE